MDGASTRGTHPALCYRNLMKVAHVMAGAPAGGAELFFERMVLAQANAGVAVLPVFRANPARAARLATLAPVQLRFGGPLDVLTPWRLRRVLRRFAPDVVIGWMNRGASVCPPGPWVLAGRLGGYYDLKYYRRCRHLIGNTSGIVDWIRGQGWEPSRVHYLPNFAPDLLGVAPAALPVPAGAPVVLALGRLHHNKAFDVLIRAMVLLPSAHAVIAGEGPEHGPLLALARRLNVADRIHLIGWRQDQGALLAAAHVLACPSRHEPLGNVVIEAWSAARPVIAADSAGPTELIRPGQDGLLVPRDNAPALAGALQEALRPNGLGQAGRARYLAEFSREPVLAQWADTLGRLR